MANFFSSDFHLGHRNIIPYTQRPFKDLDEMHKYIYDHINETCTKDDNLYILGDVSLNKKWALELPKLVKPNLYLCSGNHDQTFPYHRKAVKFINMFLDSGWKSVKLYDELVLKNGTNVLLSHMPYANEETVKYDDRYLDWRPKDEGRILLHGHIHGWYKKLDRCYDVGLDAHEMKILSEDQVIELINDPRDYIPTSITEYLKNRPKKENMKGQ